jgi:hypothetical protein
LFAAHDDGALYQLEKNYRNLLILPGKPACEQRANKSRYIVLPCVEGLAYKQSQSMLFQR